MVHDQIDIPLRKELKTDPFWQNHPEYRVCLFQTAFLPALHRITIIDAGTLYSCYTGFQSIGITEFRATVCQDIFEYRSEQRRSHTLFQAVKTRHTAPLVYRFIRKAKKSFSLVKNMVSRVLFDSLKEWIVSIWT